MSFTLPWRGKVAERSEAERGELAGAKITPSRSRFAGSTSPLQGEVKRVCGA
jgi:hypothetical protein